MMRMLKLASIKFLLFIFCFTTKETNGQNLFVDSIKTKNGFVGKSEYFYNFIKESKDSVISVRFNKEEVETFNVLHNIEVDSFSKKGIEGYLKIHVTELNEKHFIPYRNGNKHGFAFILNNSSDTIASVNYIDGEKNGVQVYKYGDILETSIYKNGKLEGVKIKKSILYNTVLEFCVYKGSKKEGLYCTYHYSGALNTFLVYHNNQVINGEYLSFYSDGQIKSKRTYEDGKLINYEQYNVD